METNNRSVCIIIAIIISMFGLTVAFASINTAVKISGSSYIKNPSWDISFQTPTNIVNGFDGKFLDDPVGGNIEGLPSSAGSTIYFQTEMSNPNDYVRFDIPIKNNGTIDAKLDHIVNHIEGFDSNFIELLITDQNGNPLPELLYLNSQETTTVTVTLRYVNISQSIPSGEEISIGITFLWVQK